jgi:biopolymer transport protein ExbB
MDVMDIVHKLSALAGFGATWVLWFLVGLSLLGAAIVVERTLCFFLTRDNVDALGSIVVDALLTGDAARAHHRLQESPSFEARIVSASLGADSLETAEIRLASASLRARIDMERHLAFLGTVGSNAPFVGLLGTVIGIIGAFRQLDASGGRLTEGLMAEVGEALVATAVGILVAIPAVAFFNVFQRVIRIRLARAEALGKDVLAALRDTGKR